MVGYIRVAVEVLSLLQIGFMRLEPSLAEAVRTTLDMTGDRYELEKDKAESFIDTSIISGFEAEEFVDVLYKKFGAK
jgi:hypothetical protein